MTMQIIQKTESSKCVIKPKSPISMSVSEKFHHSLSRLKIIFLLRKHIVCTNSLSSQEQPNTMPDFTAWRRLQVF